MQVKARQMARSFLFAILARLLICRQTKSLLTTDTRGGDRQVSLSYEDESIKRPNACLFLSADSHNRRCSSASDWPHTCFEWHKVVCFFFKHHICTFLPSSSFFFYKWSRMFPRSISITPAKPRSVWIVVTAWGGSLEGDRLLSSKGSRAAHVPGGSLPDNNVAQKPNTPLNPLSGAAGVSYQVPSGLSTLLRPGTSPLFYFPLNGPASITNLQPL